ncbi:MAG: hypothetical protein P8N43_15105, partial [Alphaproteobacteria bacterium]|nr:hypothetical protein [Alphaproteobacteria bacterium]
GQCEVARKISGFALVILAFSYSNKVFIDLYQYIAKIVIAREFNSVFFMRKSRHFSLMDSRIWVGQDRWPGPVDAGKAQ